VDLPHTSLAGGRGVASAEPRGAQVERAIPEVGNQRGIEKGRGTGGSKGQEKSGIRQETE